MIQEEMIKDFDEAHSASGLTTFERLHQDRTTIGLGEFFSWGLSEQSVKSWKVDAIIHRDKVTKTYSRQGWLRNFIIKNKDKCGVNRVDLDKTDEYYIMATSGRYYNIWKFPKEIKKIGTKI